MRIPPWPTSYALVAAFAAGAALAGVIDVTALRRHPDVALAAFAVLCAAVSSGTRPVAVVTVAALAWMFDDGFVIHHGGVLAWHGAAAGWRMGILLAAAGGGALFGAWARRAPSAVLVPPHRPASPAEPAPGRAPDGVPDGAPPGPAGGHCQHDERARPAGQTGGDHRPACLPCGPGLTGRR